MCISEREDFDVGLFDSVYSIFPGFPATVAILQARDNVAQEGTESGTLRLVLAPGSSQPPGTFFKRDLTVTINDTTSE